MCTDMGNVSHEMPTIHANVAIAPSGMPGHSHSFAPAAGGPVGEAMLDLGLRVLAGSGVELIRSPDLVDRAWDEHEAQGGRPRRVRA